MNTIYLTSSISPLRWTVAFMGIAAVWLFTPELVQAAAVTVGEMGYNAADNAKGVAKGFTVGGYAAGASMGVWGCVDMYKATKRQGESTYFGGLIKILIGSLALGIGELYGSGSASLFGSDQTTGLDELGL